MIFITRTQPFLKIYIEIKKKKGKGKGGKKNTPSVSMLGSLGVILVTDLEYLVTVIY